VVCIPYKALYKCSELPLPLPLLLVHGSRIARLAVPARAIFSTPADFKREALKGREGAEEEMRARLGCFSTGPRVPSYAPARSVIMVY